MLSDVGVEVIPIPAHIAKILNPVDNHFNSPLKQHFYNCKFKTHRQMVQAIFDSFNQISAQTIRKYYHMIGYTSNKSIHITTQKLMRQHYSHATVSQSHHRSMVNSFQKWQLAFQSLLNREIEPTHHYTL